MKEPLHQALDNHFSRHKVIFWYDEGRQQYGHFTSYDTDTVEKVELSGDEFGLKYRILKNSDRKFLVYSGAARPADEDNWLLDLNLRHFVFAANQAAGYIQELELDPALEDIVAEHLDFFANKKERRDLLAANLSQLQGTAGAGTLLDAMLSSLVGQRRSEREKLKDLYTLLMIIFRDLADGEPQRTLSQLKRYGLDTLLFRKLESAFFFQGDSLESLLTDLFLSAHRFEIERSNDPRLVQAYHFIDLWRNSWDEVETFRRLAGSYEELLGISAALENLSLEELRDIDLFKASDRIFLVRLAAEIDADRVGAAEALSLVERRKERYWYKTDTDGTISRIYGAVELFLLFIKTSDENDLTSLAGLGALDIWKRYAGGLYKIDRLYRKFLYAYREVRQDYLKPLLQKMEKRYTNTFLSRLSDHWHDARPDAALKRGEFDRQRDFFRRYASPLLGEGKVVFVICSDALRYEVASELAERLSRENRIKTEMEPAASCLPTYTQLGMAALLPHEKLQVDPESSLTRCDGISAQGLDGRRKVLEAWFARRMPDKKVKVFDASAFMDMSMSLQQEEITGQDCIYLYSATIDSTGDNAKSEQDLPDAAEKEIERLTALVKRIINLNRTHILISADHGFLYRYAPVDDTSFIQVEKSAGELWRDRRFILEKTGEHLPPEDDRFITMSAEELEIGDGFQVKLPRSVARIRRQGAGTRYVHGGMSLQEMMVPVIRIRKAREDDIRTVSYSILSSTGVITTNQHLVKIIQEEPVSAKVQPLSLTLRFEAEDGTILTNQREIHLDSRDESQENRSYSASFVFSSKIEQYNNRQIKLAVYRSAHSHLVPARDPLSYRIQISIAPDF
jgi:uncharacterized protein (TIGR02687 family)